MDGGQMNGGQMNGGWVDGRMDGWKDGWLGRMENALKKRGPNMHCKGDMGSTQEEIGFI